MVKSLIAAAYAVALAVLPLSAHAAPPAPGQDMVEWCLLNNGEVIDQPPGSSIAACCTADGCIICAADWSNCTFDPAHRAPAAGGLQFNGNPDRLAPTDQGASRPGQLPVAPLLQAQ